MMIVMIVMMMMILVLIKYSREMEYEADHIAMYLLKRANYDIHTWPLTLGGLYLLEDNKENSTMDLTFMETHPKTLDRVNAVKSHLDEVESAFLKKYDVEVAEEPVEVVSIVDMAKNWVYALFT